MLYGDAFSPDAGRCFRWVYRDDTTQPMRCAHTVSTRGWWQDRSGVWWAVDACPDHADALNGRPGPGARIGLGTGPGLLPARRPGRTGRYDPPAEPARSARLSSWC